MMIITTIIIIIIEDPRGMTPLIAHRCPPYRPNPPGGPLPLPGLGGLAGRGPGLSCRGRAVGHLGGTRKRCPRTRKGCPRTLRPKARVREATCEEVARSARRRGGERPSASATSRRRALRTPRVRSEPRSPPRYNNNNNNNNNHDNNTTNTNTNH